MDCGKFYDLEAVIWQHGIPRCSCGGIIKPEVVLYEEGLDENVLRRSIKAISQAAVLIIGGTSLSVYPAAGLIRYYEGDKMVLINRSVTPYDREADLLITAGLGEVFSKL
jgi:NAD-dependent deacetylase